MTNDGPTIAETFASWAYGLTATDLPPEVIDKAKACVLHNVATGLVGAATPMGRSVAALIMAEESAENGSTIFGSTARATTAGAAFANSVMMNVTNQCDSYRMLTHPGPCILPAALATAQNQGARGIDLLLAIVVGYEVQGRLAYDWIPTTQARGYRSAPIYGGVGAAISAGLLRELTAPQLMGALALAATSAAGTSECARVGGNEHQFHEPLAARNAVLAAMFAPVVGEVAASAFEGSAGFFNAFVGAARAPTHHFLEGDSASIEEVTGTLGQDYRILDVTFKPYPVPGFNNPIVELLKRIQRDHSIDPQDVDRVEVELNWLETTYPSPEFPRRELQQRRVGTTPYVVAQTLCDGDYARYGQWFEHGLGKGQAGERSVSDFVLTLMDKVNISSSRDRPHFAPRITISRTSGERIVDEFNGDEFKWDFDETARRAYDLAAQAGVTAEQVEGLVEAVRTLELASSLDAFTLAVSAGPW